MGGRDVFDRFEDGRAKLCGSDWIVYINWEHGICKPAEPSYRDEAIRMIHHDDL